MPSRRPIVVYLATAVMVVSAVSALVSFLFPSPWTGGMDGALDDTVALIRSWGAWGVAGSIGLMVAHSFVPFPAELLGIANGMVFGPIVGTVVTWAGAMLGAFAAFGAVRIIGQPFVRPMLSVHQQQELAIWSRESGGTSLLVARLIPVIAFNLLNYAAALTTISWWTFAWATGIFGATGNLAMRKLVPALYHLRGSRLLSERFTLLGVGRDGQTDAQYREKLSRDLREFVSQSLDAGDLDWLLARGAVPGVTRRSRRADSHLS